MAQQPMQAPPPAKGMTPQQYYMALISQGMRSQDAYAALQQAYGPPKSPQEQAQEQAQQQQNAQLAATGGQVAGIIGGSYLAGQLGGLGGGAAAAGAGTAAGAGAAGTGAAVGAGTAGVGTGAAAAGTGATAAGVGGGVATGGGAAGGGAAAGAGASAVLVPAAIVAGAAVLASNAWETGMKDIVRGRGTREDYINQVANHMTGLNLGLRLFGKRSIGSMMTSGKSQQQQIRDSFRTNLKDSGVADDKYQVTLADGSKFDIGLDGKHRFTNIDGTKRNPWDGDSQNPLSNYATGKLDPMIKRIYEGAPEDYHTEQFTGMLVNAAISNATSEKDVDANIAAMLGNSPFAKQAGIDAKNVQALTKLERPKQGEVLRLSPGLYRTDAGKIQQAKTLRQALELAYAANPQQPLIQPEQPEEIPEL